jgi:hypothetical protein
VTGVIEIIVKLKESFYYEFDIENFNIHIGKKEATGQYEFTIVN